MIFGDGDFLATTYQSVCQKPTSTGSAAANSCDQEPGVRGEEQPLCFDGSVQPATDVAATENPSFSEQVDVEEAVDSIATLSSRSTNLFG